MKKIKVFIIKNWVLICLLLIYLALAFKDPFSNRSLIPNLEPYNDTLYYSLPVINLLKGNGFKMLAFGKEAPNLVPPLYSFYLLPFFAAANNNIRVFYLANLILMFGIIVLFYKISQKVFKEKLISLFLGFFLVTNFYFFNLPSLLMAESISLFFSTLGFYLLISEKNKLNLILASWIGVCLVLAKTSNLPVAASFYLLYLLALLSRSEIKKLKYFICYLSLPAILYLVYFKFIYMANDYFNEMSSAFSKNYFVANFKFYLNSIMGKDTRYLWYQEKYASKIGFILLILGTIFGLLIKNNRKTLAYCYSFILSLVIFMSFFYYPDSRYILITLPMMIFPIGFLLKFLIKRSKFVFLGFSLIVIGYYLLFNSYDTIHGDKNLIFFKKKIALNFKYKEDPWNYFTLENANNYLKDKPGNNYLATFLSPFYAALLINNSYQYLTAQSDFNSAVMPIFKQICPSKNLVICYTKILNEGDNIYYTSYFYKGYEKDLDLIEKYFEKTLVKKGCSGVCNLYKLSLKNE